MAKENPDLKKEEYEVGYGKPPKSTQFKKGRTGNPKGRPKRSKTIPSLLTRIGMEPMKVTIKGKTRWVMRSEMAIMQLGIKAANGDLRAIGMFMDLHKLYAEARQAGELHPQLQGLVDALNAGPTERGKFNEELEAEPEPNEEEADSDSGEESRNDSAIPEGTITLQRCECRDGSGEAKEAVAAHRCCAHRHGRHFGGVVDGCY